jgi:hypothetical protein
MCPLSLNRGAVVVKKHSIQVYFNTRVTKVEPQGTPGPIAVLGSFFINENAF